MDNSSRLLHFGFSRYESLWNSYRDPKRDKLGAIFEVTMALNDTTSQLPYNYYCLNASNIKDGTKAMTSLIPQDLQALEETAHAVGQVIKATPGLGEAIYETLEFVWTDRVRFARRRRNFENQLRIAEEMMKGKRRLEDISTAEAERILEASATEDRAELQRLWAAMIARLLTGELPTVRREWIEIVKDLEVVDAGVLELLPDIRNRDPQGDHSSFIRALSSLFLSRWPDTKIEYNDFWLSLKSLESKKLLTYRGSLEKRPDGSWPPSWELTPLGRKIVEITTPPECS